MNESLKRILESKAAYRHQLARKPVSEKLRIVEQLAERTRAIRQGRQRRDQSAAKSCASPDYPGPSIVVETGA